MAGVGVLLAYHDVRAARRFFMTTLGFAEDWVGTCETAAIIPSHLRLGDVEVMVDRPGTHGVQSPRDLGGFTQVLVIGVAQVYAPYDATVGGGAILDVPPARQTWGGTSYSLKGSEG